MHYQAPDNTIHFIDSAEFEHLLPAGSVPISDAEADALRAAAPPPVPAVVEMAQARLALLQAGLLDQVQAAIDAMPGAEGQAARIAWEYRSTVRRDSPLTETLAAQLGLTQQQIDQLFTLAATL